MAEGLVSLEQNDRIAIATRDGMKDVQVGSNGTFRVDLDRWRLRDASAELNLATIVVNGTSIALDSITIEPADPIVDDGIGRIGLRLDGAANVTPSWATAAVAAALATRHRLGIGAPHNWRVDMPGGSLGVQMFPTEDGEHVSISGPAEIGPNAVVEF
jgi:diaminopimelate epimerase